MNEKPNYYSIIPAHIRYDEKLTPNAKLLYAEITSLTNKEGVCWAGDKYFMNLYGVTRPSIQNWLKQLEKGGHIKREVVYKKGSKQIEKRYISLYKINGQGYTKYLDKGIQNIKTDNSTSINTTSSNKVHGRFEEFYNAYPKKRARDQAERTFKKLKISDETLKLILKDLERRKGFKNWVKDDGQYIPNPSTYLNAGSWTDKYKVEDDSKTQYEKDIEALNFDKYTI